MFDTPLCEILTQFETDEQTQAWLESNDVRAPESVDMLTNEQRELLLMQLEMETLPESSAEMLNTHTDGEEARINGYAEYTYASFVTDSMLRNCSWLRGSHLLLNLMPANTIPELTESTRGICVPRYRGNYE